MIAAVHRINLLTVLVLLVSGLLQPLAAAQGVMCGRTHAPAQAAQRSADPTVGFVASMADGPRDSSIDHQHSSIPQPDETSAPSVPCGVAALPAERSMPSPNTRARHLLPAGDLPPASLLIQSLFRPPRLS
jgi:hypothetical protein